MSRDVGDVFLWIDSVGGAVTAPTHSNGIITSTRISISTSTSIIITSTITSIMIISIIIGDSMGWWSAHDDLCSSNCSSNSAAMEWYHQHAMLFVLISNGIVSYISTHSECSGIALVGIRSLMDGTCGGETPR